VEEKLVAEHAELTPLVRQLAHFSEVADPPTVQVFLVANAEERDGGGGANGGRIVVEVPLIDPIGVLMHESLHQLLRPKEGAMRVAAEAAGLDFIVIKEAIAYAVYPGILGNTEDGDQLAEELVQWQLRGVAASDRFLQFDQLAVVIRPLLKAALAHGETISSFLPKVAAKWHRVAQR